MGFVHGSRKVVKSKGTKWTQLDDRLDTGGMGKEGVKDSPQISVLFN